MAARSSTSATATSAPLPLHAWPLPGSRTTTRTAFPCSSSVLATTLLVLPVAPNTTNMGSASSARRDRRDRRDLRPPQACDQWMRYITRMNDVHLGAFDLNLLVALDALLVEGNVTKAAARIGVTQSAASHALSRLRRLTGDELLVRGRDGMVPTMRAEAMRAPLRRSLDEITSTLSPPRPFDPGTARLRFFIGTSDYAELVLLPGVMARLGREAPGVELRALPVGHDPALELSTGKLDVVIMPAQPNDDSQGIRGRKMFSDRFVCIARSGHPLART